MSESGSAGTPPNSPVLVVPSQDGLRLIVAGVGYLLLICILQTIVTLGSVGVVPRVLPAKALSIRDAVALLGWVGFMISGVSVIIVPNHLKGRVHPKSLPQLHLVLANVGLIGYLSTSFAMPGILVSVAFLAIVSVSFLAFGLGVMIAMFPYLQVRDERRSVTTAATPDPSIGQRASP
ncbi:MAG: hypothetical protein ACREDK_07820 [Thermoplasmata archaeon]